MLEIVNGNDDRSHVTFEKGKIAPSEIYLGATVQQQPLNGYDCWTISSTNCVKAVIDTVVKQQ